MTFGADQRPRSSLSRAARLFRFHCARRCEEAHALPVRAVALMASDSSSVRRIVSLSGSGLGQAARTADTTAGSCEKIKRLSGLGFCRCRTQAFVDAYFRRVIDSLARRGALASSSLEIK